MIHERDLSVKFRKDRLEKDGEHGEVWQSKLNILKARDAIELIESGQGRPYTFKCCDPWVSKRLSFHWGRVCVMWKILCGELLSVWQHSVFTWLNNHPHSICLQNFPDKTKIFCLLINNFHDLTGPLYLFFLSGQTCSGWSWSHTELLCYLIILMNSLRLWSSTGLTNCTPDPTLTPQQSHCVSHCSKAVKRLHQLFTGQLL